MNTAEYLNTLIECKEDIKTALIEKGAPPTGGLSTYADAILDIDADLNLNSTGWDETTIGYAIESLQNRINWTVDYVNDKILNNTSGVQLFGFDDYKAYNTALTFFPANVDISKYNDISYFFRNQDGLIFIGDINTHNAENVHNMFDGCRCLISTPDLDFTNVINANGVFEDCSSLERIGNISNFGIQPNFKSSGLFMYCYNLEPESVVNFFNNLYDRASAGYSMVELGFQRECLSKLSENDLMIAINKGYSIVGYV